MLVGPGGKPARRVDHAVNCVRADEIPGVNRLAPIEWIALQLIGVDGKNAAIEGGIGTAAVDLCLVKIVAFFVFRLRPVNLPLDAVAGREPVSGRGFWRSEDAVIRDVIKRSNSSGAATSHERHQPRERIGGPRSTRTRIVHARLAQGGQGRAGVRCHAVFVINRVHPINADEQNMFNLVPVAETIVGSKRGRKGSADQSDRQSYCKQSLFQVNLLCSRIGKRMQTITPAKSLGGTCYSLERES